MAAHDHRHAVLKIERDQRRRLDSVARNLLKPVAAGDGCQPPLRLPHSLAFPDLYRRVCIGYVEEMRNNRYA